MSETESDLKSKVVDELREYLDVKFDKLKRTFKEESEWTAENVRKKVRSDNSVSIKSTSNKKQFVFNSDVSDILDSAEKAISLRNADKALEFLSEAQGKLKQRNKLIRIADASPAGWLTIQEYEQSEVASDAEDDRRIRRAEDRAKVRMEKYMKATKTPANPFKDSAGAATGNINESFRSRFRRQQPQRMVTGGQQPGRDVVCYACGGTGHFASGCAAFVRQQGARSVGQSTGPGGIKEDAKSETVSTKQ